MEGPIHKFHYQQKSDFLYDLYKTKKKFYPNEYAISVQYTKFSTQEMKTSIVYGQKLELIKALQVLNKGFTIE